jgi:eukaryotic-like serine/threonine-protein kinase
MLGTILHSHYQVVKVLGIGKSGTTYLAKDLDLIDSPLYVLKKINYINASGGIPALAEKLFEIQGDIARQVGQHPHIPALVAKFEVDGERYFVREYIDGEPLSQELTPGSIWSQTQVFDFLIDLMLILDFVHSFKYIHQDINPQNIIRGDRDGRFNLIGFSCVKDLESIWQNSPKNDARNLNNSSYVPYEQEQNTSKLNSDIYAVGAIAIQALTGRFPIEKDAHSYELKWRDEVKIDLKLVEIIHRMVRPDYRNRYQSAAEVLQDLQSFALTQIPARQSHRLKPYLLSAAAAACMLLIGFSVVKIFSAPPEQPQLSTSTLMISNTPITVSNGITWQSYLDRMANIQIKYPDTWRLVDIQNIFTGENVLFTSPVQMGSKYQENVSIRVENLTNPQTSLDDYTQSAIAEISKYYKNVKIIESSATILAKKPGSLIVYTGKDKNSLLVKNLEVWTIDRGKAYILAYKAAPDRYHKSLETAMTMINSFKVN